MFFTSLRESNEQIAGQERRERMARDLEQIRREVEEEEEALHAQRTSMDEQSQNALDGQEGQS